MIRPLIIIMFLALSSHSFACKCSTDIDYSTISDSSNILYIKVTSIKLKTFVNNDGFSREDITIGYELLETLWGPERAPVLGELLDSCKSNFYPGNEYIVAVPKIGRFGVENLISSCSGIRWVGSTKIEVIEVKKIVNEYIQENS